jgi:hypothetical protein
MLRNVDIVTGITKARMMPRTAIATILPATAVIEMHTARCTATLSFEDMTSLSESTPAEARGSQGAKANRVD